MSPWKQVAPALPGIEYLAMLTYLPLRGYRQIPSFVSYSFRIQKQLARTRGVIGFATRAKPMSNQYWTLSVWENDRALMEFVRTEPHASSMTAFQMGKTRFTRWKLQGAEIPPSWNDALRKENANG